MAHRAPPAAAARARHNDSLRAAGLDTIVPWNARRDTARLTAVTITASPPPPNRPYTAVTITQAQIAVAPANPSVPTGETEQFTATGTYSDQVTWASATPSAVSI